MLSKLTKPALLLPGKLQAVVKAQRIYLQPGSDYSGCWHYDGKKEDIIAVVLYYYRYTAGLQGGDIEFMSRRPVHDNFEGRDHTVSEARKFIYENGYCRVPVKTGTLLVFSNFECVHRVLKMHFPSD